MAIIIASARDNRSTKGEKEVLKILRGLDNECIIYSQPNLCRGYPDYVAIIPDVGVFVIEVKDWKSSSILAVDRNGVLLSYDGKEEYVEHPVSQARRYLKCLRDGLLASKYNHVILSSVDGEDNKLQFPVGGLVILRNITRSELEKKDIEESFPAQQVLTKEDVEKLKPGRVDQVSDACRNSLLQWKPFRPMDENQIAVVRSVISPETVIDDAGLHLKILDLDQEEIARRKFGGHRSIYGPAGTGKTVIILARAKLLAGNEARKILVLCFNSELSKWLRNKLANFHNIEVRTFNSFARRYGVGFEEFQNKSELGSQLSYMLEKNRDRNLYDSILIDEAQDFPKEWFKCILLSLKSSVHSDLFIAGDGAQSSAQIRKFSWKSIGIEVPGVRSKRLTIVYRCTKEIYEAACVVLQNRQGPSDDDNPLRGASPGNAIRSGPQLSLIRLKSRKEECDYAAAMIETWLLAGFEYRRRRAPVEAQDIAILYPFEGPFKELLNDFITKVSKFAGISVLRAAGGSGNITDRNVKLLTIQRSKGLQFRHVILLWADTLQRSRFDDSGDARVWMSIAMTRAEQSLTILHTDEWAVLSDIEEHLTNASLPLTK